MEFFRRISRSLDSLNKTIDSVSAAEASPQEKCDAAEIIRKASTKEAALELIAAALMGLHIDPNPRSGYFYVLREGAVLKATNFGATKEEIENAIDQGITKAAQGSAWLYRFKQDVL